LMPELPLQGIDAPAPNAARMPITDAPAGGASRGGGVADDAARAKRLRALAAEIETLPTTHAAFARLLAVAVESLQGAGAWIGLTMEDTDALVVVASYGDVPVEAGTRVPRDRAFAARALQSKSAIFADPSTGVRWSDTIIARTPVRAVAAPLLVDPEHAVGIISVIGGPGRLFTVADGTFAHELGSLASQILRRRDVVQPPVVEEAAPVAEISLATPMLLDAAAALSVDDFAAAVIHRLDDPALLGVSIAVRDRAHSAMRFPAALGALAALRGVRTPLDDARAEHLARQRRAIQMPDARHLVPDGWRSLVPALPGASIALVDNNVAVGRVDVVYDPDRPVPQEVMRRIEQLAATVARALAVVQTRVARTPTDHGLESLQALRTTLTGRLHDLTSPLAGISALAELMTDEQLSPELHESIALIQRSARRANEAANTLRALADDADAFSEPVVVEALIHDILRERSEAQRALTMTVNVTVDPSMPPLPWPASALRDWLSSAVIASETALLSSSKRRIDIRATIDGAHAVITVADDGVRITNVPSDATLHGASITVVRTDDGRTIRRLAIPLRIGNSPHAS
jgi:signal transduction histidine kinase